MKKIIMNKRTWICILLAIVYFLTTLPFADLTFLDGYSEVRVSGLLPMAAGLLFGFPGALACALGNLAGDVYDGWDVFCFFGFFGNFLMAWLPYKLWHTLFLKRERGPVYLDYPTSVLKFVIILIIASCGSTGVIAAGGHLLDGFQYTSFFLPVALQYYSLSTLGGMLIFQMCASKIPPRIPLKAYNKDAGGPMRVLDYVLAGSLVLLSSVVLPLVLKYHPERTILSEVLCVAVLIFTGLLAITPISKSKAVSDQKPTYTMSKGIKAQSSLFFFMILCGMLIFLVGLSYRLLAVDFRYMGAGRAGLDVLWLRVIITISVAATILIVFLALILKLIQRKVVSPLASVTEYANEFVKGDHLNKGRIHIAGTGNELEVLSESINFMADEIEKFIEDIRLRTIKEGKIAAELSVARTIQQGMLPDDWCGTNFDLSAFIKPAKEVGGDFYHYVQLDDERVLLVIADVSGKDISAAMFMAQAKALIEANSHLPPAEMLTSVNQTLAQGNKAMMFVTVFATLIDRKNQVMEYANAGHNPPICYNQGKTFWLENDPDFVLGAMEGVQYEKYKMEINEDFRLFIYTDGVNEAESCQGGFFGNDKLLECAEAFFDSADNSRQFIDQMEQELDQFTEGAQQSDDITMMVLALD